MNMSDDLNLAKNQIAIYTQWLNNKPNEENFLVYYLALKSFSKQYEKEYGYKPKILIDQFMSCLSQEVIDKYKDRLPLGENVVPFEDEE